MTQTFNGCASITDSKRNWSPGPATYNPKLQDEQSIPKWTLKPKIEQTGCFSQALKNVNPGPSQYNPQKHTEQHNMKKLMLQKIKMQKTNVLSKTLKSDRESQRKREEAVRNYQNLLKKNANLLNKNIVKNQPINGKAISFGYKDDIGSVFKVQQTSPGPIYDVGGNFSKKSGGKWGQSFINKMNKQNTVPMRKSEDYPGPGNYFQSNSPSKSGYNWSIGNSKRGNLLQHSTSSELGPGSYSPQLLTPSRNCTFKGKYNQNNKLGQQYCAAPGSYEIPDTKSKKGTVFKHGEDSDYINTSNGQQSPSPFSYNLQNSLSKGGFSLGRKLQVFQNKATNPGPGSYQLVDQELLACKKSKQGYNSKIGGYMGRKISSQKKNTQSQDNFYKYNPNIDAVGYEYPKFSFSQCNYSSSARQKYYEKLGPGSYSIDYSSLPQKKGQSYSIPKNQRFKPLRKENSSITKKVCNQPTYGSIGYIPKYIAKNKNKSKKLTESQFINKITQKDSGKNIRNDE